MTEQKEKIASEPTKRWVIKFGRVLIAEGAFVSKSKYSSFLVTLHLQKLQ